VTTTGWLIKREERGGNTNRETLPSGHEDPKARNTFTFPFTGILPDKRKKRQGQEIRGEGKRKLDFTSSEQDENKEHCSENSI